MTCSEFLERFSDFHDGDGSLPDRGAFVRHLEGCPSCRRYERVLVRGVAVLREADALEPRGDFRDRLRHSLYRLDEERRRSSLPRDGAGPLAIAAVGLLLALLAWSPLLRAGDPSVDLPAIMAGGPAPTEMHPLFRHLDQELAPVTRAAPTRNAVLWSHSNALLLEHSPLRARSSESGFVRTEGR